MNRELDAYRRQRAPDRLHQEVKATFGERVDGRRPIWQPVFGLGAAAAGALVLAVVLGSGPGNPGGPRDPGSAAQAARVPAGLSLTRLSMPEKPSVPVPSPSQLEVPSLNQIHVNFDLASPEELL